MQGLLCHQSNFTLVRNKLSLCQVTNIRGCLLQQSVFTQLIHFFCVRHSDRCCKGCKNKGRISLVVQWLRIHLPVQGTWVQSLVWELRSHIQFSSVTQSCPTLWDTKDCSTSGLPVHHQLPDFIQTHVHRVGDAIQPSHPLSPPSPPALNLSQHQGLFQWVSSLHQVAKLLEFQLQHQSFQWTVRVDFL